MRDGASTCDAFKRNAVSFVTFNFDTNIEDRFDRYTRNAYGEGYCPDVHHVHGTLPTLPSWMKDRHYGDFNPEWFDWLKEAAANVHVVTDDIEAAISERAQKMINEAVVVCFLGFAYAIPNLARLGFPRPADRGWPRILCGSGFQMENAEQFKVKNRLLNSIELAPKELKCRGALRHLPVFRD